MEDPYEYLDIYINIPEDFVFKYLNMKFSLTICEYCIIFQFEKEVPSNIVYLVSNDDGTLQLINKSSKLVENHSVISKNKIIRKLFKKYLNDYEICYITEIFKIGSDIIRDLK